MKPRLFRRRPCPQCGHGLRRIARLAYQRETDPGMARYVCRNGGCGWEGLLEHSGARHVARVRELLGKLRRRFERRYLAGTLAGLLGVAVGAGGALLLTRADQPAQPLGVAQELLIPLGKSYDGEALPPSHPLLILTSMRAAEGPEKTTGPDASAGRAPAKAWPAVAGGATKPAAGTAVAAAEAGALSLRQRCAWGQPGRNPYRGTADEALRAAHLPPDIARRLSEKIARRDTTDRLKIMNASIRGQDTGQSFDSKNIAMTYGRTLCLHTRVNFVEGHEERADLYQVTDQEGKRYSVMVPEACGNVSVLGAREEEDGKVMGERAEEPEAPKEAELPHLFLPQPDLRHPQGAGPDGNRPTIIARGGQVPEPGTLALGALALGLLALARKR